MKEALRQLKELQAERRERYKTEMDDAIRLQKTQETKGLPFDPAEIGFVFASAEVTLEAARRDRLADSKRAEKAGFNLTEYLCTAGDLVAAVLPRISEVRPAA
jgi:hypothetical protein